MISAPGRLETFRNLGGADVLHAVGFWCSPGGHPELFIPAALSMLPSTEILLSTRRLVMPNTNVFRRPIGERRSIERSDSARVPRCGRRPGAVEAIESMLAEMGETLGIDCVTLLECLGHSTTGHDWRRSPARPMNQAVDLSVLLKVIRPHMLDCAPVVIDEHHAGALPGARTPAPAGVPAVRGDHSGRRRPSADVCGRLERSGPTPDWSDTLLEHLQLLGDIVAAALQRRAGKSARRRHHAGRASAADGMSRRPPTSSATVRRSELALDLPSRSPARRAPCCSSERPAPARNCSRARCTRGPRRGADRQRQLRRAAADAHRERAASAIRAVRSPARWRSARPLRAGASRHSVPRRNRRSAARSSGQAAAGAAGGDVRTPGIVAQPGRRRPHHCRDAPGSDAACLHGCISRGSSFYRLNVFPIRLPSLRERCEDIPALVWSIIRKRQSALHRCIANVPRTSWRRCSGRRGRSSIRELENVVERALIHSSGETLILDGTRRATTEPQPPVTARH